MLERIRDVPLFAGLAEEDLERIVSGVTEMALPAGSVLFTEGEAGDQACVVLDGEVEVVKATERRETVLAVRGAGDVMGEMSLLRDQPRNATVRARSDVTVAMIPRSVLDDLLDTSPAATRTIFTTLLDRYEDTNSQLQFSERLAQLGTVTAGVAHELNNPAAAIKRSVEQLEDALDEYRDAIITTDLDSTAIGMLGTAAGEAQTTPRVGLSSIQRSDLEEEMAGLLSSDGVGDAWRRAAALVDAGVTPSDLEVIRGRIDDGSFAGAVLILAAAIRVRSLVSEIRTSAGRLTAIIGALKSYTYLDLAAVQEVDIRKGIDETLLILGHKLRDIGIEVVREYAEDLPLITAFGTELNQVWTNLVDNAADALSEGTPSPRITIRVCTIDDEVAVEIEDNGPGIPEEIERKVFDPFFTTKPPGKGTGLGLQTTRRIVVNDHRGDVTIESEPGRTVFRVTLPVDQPKEDE